MSKRIPSPTTTLRQLRKAAELFLIPAGYRFSAKAATRFYRTLRAAGAPQADAFADTAARFDTQIGILQRIVCGTAAEERAWTSLAHRQQGHDLDAHPGREGTPTAYVRALESKAETPLRVRATQGK